VSEFYWKSWLVNSVTLVVNVALLSLLSSTKIALASTEVDSKDRQTDAPTRVIQSQIVADAELLNEVDRYANQGTANSGNSTLDSIDSYADTDTIESDRPILNQVEGYNRKGTSNTENSLLNAIDEYGTEGEVNRKESQQILPVISLTEEGYWKFQKELKQIENVQLYSISQVNSVTQLRDVQPTDWAYEALKNLVEQYGVIQGYPDGTFRGTKSLSRYEFAAALNTALEKVNQTFLSGGNVSKNDLETLEKLQNEFTTELAVISSRVGDVENRLNILQANSFAPTSKLFGLAYFHVTTLGALNNDPIKKEAGLRDAITNRPIVQDVGEPNTTASGLVWLNIGTSFTGKDLLITQLAAGKGLSPANQISSVTSTVNVSGIPFTDAGAFLGPGAPVVLRELVYEFPLFDNARLAVGARINWFRFFDENPYTFFLNGTSSLNSIANTLTSDVRRGTGAILKLPLNDRFRLNVGYLAQGNEFQRNNSAANVLEGLFGGTNILTAELAYKVSDTFNIKFLYSRLNQQATTVSVNGTTISPNKYISGSPINGVADDGFGGPLINAQSDIFEVNLDWLVASKIGFFGRYGISNTDLNAVDSSRNGSITTQTFQVGFAVLDLFKEGAQGTLSFLMPFFYSDGQEFLSSGAGDGGTQYELEGVYYYPINQNIAIVPNFQVLFNPNNFNSNPTVFVFNLRTQFSF
jgi:hypothetical protein